MPGKRTYEDFMRPTREEKMRRVQEAYKRFQETQTFEFPTWLYGEPMGTLFKLEVEDCPRFGDTAYLEFDSARTVFMVVDMQIDFCGEKGYVDQMGYKLQNTAQAIEPIKNCLKAVRETDINIMHTREGHDPSLSDAPYNKILRSKIIGEGIGIGDTPPGGLGELLVRGQKNWDIIDDLYPEPGEYIVDKASKGAFGQSTIHQKLKNMVPPPTHLVITGITADVCPHTIMREANDLGYWCVFLKDCSGATDPRNHEAAVRMIKMQGGVFGWASDSERWVKAVQDTNLK